MTHYPLILLKLTLTFSFIANDDIPYRDLLIYVNSVLEDHRYHDNISLAWSFALDIGDNFTIIVRAVGNVSVISVHNASYERFTCKIEFTCEKHLDEVANRCLQCSLRSPAELSDDGRELRILIDNVELTTINITCK